MITLEKVVLYLADAAMAAMGFALWALIPILTGRREAWDSSIYFTVGIPTIAAVSGLLGYLLPNHWWHFGLAAFLSQAIYIIVKEPTANMLPPGLVVLAVFCLPSFATACLGARLSARLTKRQ
jgi:uncharacterized membrane protein YuzA (DUF378 family)